MKVVQECKTGFRWEIRRCIDCGEVFIAKNARSVRCLDCRSKYHKEVMRQYRLQEKAAGKKAKAEVKKEPKPVKEEPKNVIDESKICKKIETCYYGGKMGAEHICDFLSKTGTRRPCKAGECYFYKKKGSDDEQSGNT